MIKFCTECGQATEQKIPADDDRLRAICTACEYIHYENPRIITGCIPVWEDKVLLCKRAIEPRRGYWTLPAGFMENGETVAQGAARETWEEAEAKAVDLELFSVISVPYISQVYMFYRANLAAPEFGPGIESLEVELRTEAEVPWDDLAFPTVKKTLQWFFEDRKKGQFQIHQRDFETPPWKKG